MFFWTKPISILKHPNHSMRISESEFGVYIGKYNNVLYLCHRNADPDAIGSAFALARAFGGTVAAVDDLSRTGEAAANIIGAEVLINPRADAYDLIVVVDTSVRLQLGEIRLEKYALIDHHLDEGILRRSGVLHSEARQIHGRDRLDDFKGER